MKKQLQSQSTPSASNRQDLSPAASVPAPWHLLSEVRKSQILLQSSRLPDHSDFLMVFKSLEQPDIE